MKKNKKGMSIAAVLGIMICLVSAVTTCFILAIRSSILTSRSLRYIESYNNASSEIDNAISFIETETNARFDGGNGSISKEFVESMCYSVEGLFGVDSELIGDSLPDTIDMSVGFGIVVQAEYTKVNTQKDYLVSLVKFAASGEGGTGIINPILAIDKIRANYKEGKLTLEDLIKTRYNSTNLLWNYWSEQRAGLSYDRGECDNKLIETLGTDFVLTNIISDINNWFAGSDDYDITTQMTATRLIEVLWNLMENKMDVSNILSWIKGEKTVFKTYSNFEDCFEDKIETQWWPEIVTVHIPGFAKKDENGVTKAIVIDRNIRIDNLVDYMDKGVPIYITNNAVVFARGGLKTNSDVYIERGSSLIVGGNFEMIEYTNSLGAKVAPILDTDYVTSTVVQKESQEGPYVGGGLFVKGDLKYEAIDSKGVVLSDSRYDYYSKLNKTCDAYVNGNFTASGKVSILYDREATESANGKLSVGATIYCDGDTSISNIGFASTKESVRPFLLFCNADINVKYCVSLFDGETAPYTKSWDSIKDEKIGFAIITCEKLKTLNGSPYLVAMNMFHNNTSEAENDKSDIKLLDATKDMLGGSTAYTKYGIYNGFVNENALKNCSKFIEADSVHWYIPSKLRGGIVAASISASEAARA